jgi:hypothetical protein
MKVHLLLVNTLLLVIILMAEHFKCHERCGRTFTAPGGLTRHHKSCSHWQQQLVRQLMHFKRGLDGIQGPAVKKVKLNTTSTVAVSLSTYPT